MLQPIEREPARRLIDRATGGVPGDIDPNAYVAFMRRLIVGRPSFLLAGEAMEVLRKTQRAIPLEDHSVYQYRAGVCVYYGAIQEQAKHVGLKAPIVTPDDARTVLLESLQSSGIGSEVSDLTGMFDKRVAETGANVAFDPTLSVEEDAERFYREMGGKDAEAEMLVFDDGSANNRQVLENVYAATSTALSAQVLRFCETETAFTEVMVGQGLWPSEPIDQYDFPGLIGASDSFRLVEAATQRLAA